MRVFDDREGRKESGVKYRKDVSLILLTIAIAALLACDSHPAGGVNVRVRLGGEKKEVRLAVKGAYTIEAIDSDLILEKGVNLTEQKVTPDGTGIQIGEKLFKIYGIRVIPKKTPAY